MRKITFKQLLWLLAAVLPAQLMAVQPLAERTGTTDPSAPSALSSMVQAKPETKMSMLEPFEGTGGMRGYLTTSVAPSAIRPISVMNVPASNINLIGSVVYSDTQAPGMYRLPMVAGGSLEAIVTGESKAPKATHGAVAIDGIYYVSWQYDFYGMMLINYVDSYDMNTWQRLTRKEISNTAMLATDVSLDPVTGKVYGCYFNDNATGYVFGTADYKEYKRTPISEITVPWNGVAFDTDGKLYAIDINGDLLTVNKETGATTKIGSTGVTPKYLTSAVIDPKSHRMFWTVFGDDKAGKLYEVNKTTGVATQLCQFPGNEEVCGLVVIAPEAEDYAPAVVENVILNFPNGSLEGTVDFKAPTTYFCGETATGDINYRILANGVEVATGTTTFGASVKAPVAIKKAGDYEFAVSVSNASGTSPVVKVSGFIGSDTPVAPKASLVCDNDKFVLTWDAVKESVNGGYIDVANIRYTVTRYPDNKVVAEKISATTFTEPVPASDELTSYYYTVVAHAGEATSGVAKSNVITLGSVTPPYTSKFNTSSGLDGFTIIDVNGDGKQWKLDSSRAYLVYNSKLDSDDWLITPPLKLQKGKTYKVDYKVSTKSGSYKERIEVKWGNAPTAEGLTSVILEPMEFASLVGLSYDTYITPEADGLYYIGFHGISVKNAYGIYVDNFAISEGIDLTAPDMSTNLTVVPDYDGANKATISFTAPAKNINGDALTALTKVEVLRNGSLIKTFDAPAVGANLSFVDNVEKAATYVYEVVGYNTAGMGKGISLSKFVGINKPAGVTNLTAVETAVAGEVTFNWEAPKTDANGDPMNPSLITYDLYEFTVNYKYVPIKEGLTTTTYTYQAVPADGEQELKQWVVFSRTQGGEGQGVQTDVIAVGPNYEMPFIESVADGQLSYNFTSDQAKGGVWRPYTLETMPDVAPYDADNGMFGMKGTSKDATGSIITGKIKVSGNRPGLVFYTFNINGTEPDANELNVYVREGNSEKLLKNVVMSSLDNAAWNRVVVPLDAYKDKVIYLRFEGITRNYTYTFLDNIRVMTLMDNNITALSVEAPSKVNTGEEFDVTVKYENAGLDTAENYVVHLYRNGTAVVSMVGPALESGMPGAVTFKQTIGVIDSELNEYSADISFTPDEDKSDNAVLATVTVKAVSPKYPTVSTLRAEYVANGVSLAWTAPDLTVTKPAAMTETFENGDPFATTFDGWTFVDVDGKSIGGMEGIELPGVPQNSKQSYFVFDNSGAEFNSTFDAHSGTKYLAAMFNADYSEVNDWAISPRLYGCAQTISFFARSYHNRYKESIEILYSTGSLDPADFVSLAKYDNIDYTWTEFKADLPEGARYFAIRSYARGAFMLLIDDVTYVPASIAEGLQLSGYNVYCDGKKIIDSPIADAAMIDTQATPGNHTYAVTAVYTVGESVPVTVELMTTAVADIVTGDVTIAGATGTIVIDGAQGQPVAVYGVDGRTVYVAVATEIHTEIAVAPAMYVVKAGDTVAKVAVK